LLNVSHLGNEVPGSKKIVTIIHAAYFLKSIVITGTEGLKFFKNNDNNINNHIIAVMEDAREMVFLLQHLSVAVQMGNAVAFLATFDAV